MKNDSIENKTGGARRPNWGLFIPGFLFTAFSIYISYAIFWSHQKQSDAAGTFEPILAKILVSEVSQINQRDETTTGPVRTYRPRIRYQYEVDGNTYQSTRFSYLAPAYSGREGAQEIVDRYPVGSRHTAYYNPAAPSEAVLHRSVTRIDFLSGYFWVPTLMVAAGFFCIYAGWKGWRTRGMVYFRGR